MKMYSVSGEFHFIDPVQVTDEAIRNWLHYWAEILRLSVTDIRIQHGMPTPYSKQVSGRVAGLLRADSPEQAVTRMDRSLANAQLFLEESEVSEHEEAMS